MGRLNAQQRIAFSRVQYACGEAQSVVGLLKKISQVLRSAVQADAFCSSQLDPATGLLIDAVSDGWPDEAKPMLLKNVLLQTPAADPYLLFKLGHRAVDIGMLLENSEMMTADRYFRYHLLPFGYFHELQCLCSADSTPQALLTFSRSAAHGTFEPADLRLLSIAAPHIGKAVRRIEMQSMRQALPGCDSGMILIKKSGKIVYESELVRDWRDQVRAANTWSLGLDLAVKLATLTDESANVLLPIMLRSPATGDLYRLRRDDAHAPDGSVALFLEPFRPAFSIDALRRLGLSPRESEVALSLIRGSEPKSISTELGCSIHTVHQHKKQVYDKLAVSSRLELAFALLGPAPN